MSVTWNCCACAKRITVISIPEPQKQTKRKFISKHTLRLQEFIIILGDNVNYSASEAAKIVPLLSCTLFFSTLSSFYFLLLCVYPLPIFFALAQMLSPKPHKHWRYLGVDGCHLCVLSLIQEPAMQTPSWIFRTDFRLKESDRGSKRGEGIEGGGDRETEGTQRRGSSEELL